MPARKRPSSMPRRAAMALAAAAALLLGGLTLAEPASEFLRVRAARLREKPELREGESGARLYAGQPLEVLERKGDWVKIRCAPQAPVPGAKERPEPREGWLHATLLAEAPPPASAPARPWLEDGGRAFKEPQEHEAGRAAPHAKARRLDLEPVYRLERRHPSADDLDAFLQAGQLGLYRPDWPSQEEGVQP
ncbi:MAG: SH3 domain-containing protein [Planctomycetota bacterium]|nr:SH3 domain-containing protein [Planctomycetota bacterium]